MKDSVKIKIEEKNRMSLSLGDFFFSPIQPPEITLQSTCASPIDEISPKIWGLFFTQNKTLLYTQDRKFFQIVPCFFLQFPIYLSVY